MKLPEITSRITKYRHFPLIVQAVVILTVFSLGVTVGSNRISIERRGDGSVAINTSPEKLNYDSVDQLYNILKNNYDGDISPETALNGIKEGLAESTGDEYTEYFDNKEAKEFNEQLDGSFEGIGAELGKDKSNYVIIIAPLPNTPAEKAGIKPRDIILQVNDENAFGWSVEEAKNKIRGQKDTVVKLRILRGSEQIELSITRAKIIIESVQSSINDGVGYLKINQFGNDTVPLARKAAEDFTAQRVRGVVVDLRGNPGGYLEGAVDVASIWLGKNQKVVEERRSGQTLRTRYAKGEPVLKDIPVVVLINEGSASASEIIAGALRDNAVAVLVGAKSYGKGSVQQVTVLEGGGALKVTIARWFTPAGRNIDKEGITPDHEVEISEADIAAQRDPQKDKAYELIRQKAR